MPLAPIELPGYNGNGGMRLKIAGIIAEYNPFHNGHRYHLEQTRSRTQCDYVIAVLAGHFTQRGESAVASKWERTRMALLCGVDAVFELPALFAVRPADAFARGGVGILAGLGADWLSFGSEISDLELLMRLARWREEEPEEISCAIRRKLALGMPHARARGEAWAEALGMPPEALNRPNTALAVEYLRAMRGTGMVPVLVERLGEYHEERLNSGPNAQGPRLASATALRRAISRGEDVREYVPKEAVPLLPRASRLSLDMLALDRLRRGNFDFPDAPEGLDRLLVRAARESGSVEEALERCKSRRYTYARLSRAVAHCLLGMERALVERYPAPEYARLLGLRESARPLLRELSRRSRLPIAANARSLRGDECFSLECRATDLWALGDPNPALRRAGREFTEGVVRL